MRHYRNIIVIKINPQSRSRSPITQHYLIFKKYFTRNNLFSIPQIPFMAYRRSPNLRDLLVRAKLKNTNTTPKPTSDLESNQEPMHANIPLSSPSHALDQALDHRVDPANPRKIELY